MVQIYFAQTDIHYTDTLYIFDGPDTSSPLIGAYNSFTTPSLYLSLIEASLNNPSGCLTVRFVSDGASEATGWNATIQCAPICQEIIASLNPILTSPPPDTGYITICPGQEITFSGSADYTENDMVYHQDDASSTYTWYFGDGTSAVGQTVNHTYGDIGGYTVTLYIEDVNGCVNSNSIETRIAIAGNPFDQIIVPADVCANDTAYLVYANVSGQTIEGTPFYSEITTTLGVSDTTFLPDGTGTCYETSVIFNCFEPGQTLDNPQDFLSLDVNMEHSWLGDLNISIICPNGQTLILHEFISAASGGGTYLGVPIDDDAILDPGVGEDYSWTPITPTYGTMTTESDNYSTLPTGSYTPDGSFADLVGCPLNGEWTIEICDYWGSDNGYIFGWSMSLNPLIAPDTWSYTVGIDQQSWTAGPYIVSSNDTSAAVVPPTAGTYTYTYTIVDHYGCQWDTTTTLTAIAAPNLNLGNDIVICDDNTTVVLDAGNATSYIWDDGSTTQTIQTNQEGTYYVTATIGLCAASDDISVSYHTGFQLTENHTDVSCFGKDDGEITVNATSDFPPSQYSWSNLATTSTNSNLVIGTYTVTISDVLGCDTTQTITINQPIEVTHSYTVSPVSCYGDQDGSINLTVSGGTTPYSFLWSNGGASEDLSNIYAGTYYVTVTDANGCSLSEHMNIIQPNDVVVSLPNDFTVCKSLQYTLQSSVTGGANPYTYSWNSSESTMNIDYTLTQETEYALTVTDAHGCTGSNSVLISVYDDLVLDAFSDLDTVCKGDPVTISGSISGGLMPYSININGSLTILPIIVYPTNAETYSIEVTDACSYKANEIINLYTYSVPTLSFSADTLQGCPPLGVSFNLASYENTSNYTWSFGDGAGSVNTINPMHYFQNSGLFDVSVDVVDKNGCKDNLTIEKLINVYPRPDAKFEPTPNVVTFINPVIDFTNYSDGNDNNYWDLGDGALSSLSSPTHSYQEIGTYSITLVVENSFGCRDTAVDIIVVQDAYSLYVPTAFSPDGDGINDLFFVKGHGIDTDNFTIKVYNRWGEVIWETADMFDTWDGTVKGMDDVQAGTYTWLVICKDFTGDEHTKSGVVSIIK